MNGWTDGRMDGWMEGWRMVQDANPGTPGYVAEAEAEEADIYLRVWT